MVPADTAVAATEVILSAANFKLILTLLYKTKFLLFVGGAAGGYGGGAGGAGGYGGGAGGHGGGAGGAGGYGGKIFDV